MNNEKIKRIPVKCERHYVAHPKQLRPCSVCMDEWCVWCAGDISWRDFVCYKCKTKKTLKNLKIIKPTPKLELKTGIFQKFVDICKSCTKKKSKSK